MQVQQQQQHRLFGGHDPQVARLVQIYNSRDCQGGEAYDKVVKDADLSDAQKALLERLNREALQILQQQKMQLQM